MCHISKLQSVPYITEHTIGIVLRTSWDAKIPSAITEITRLKPSRHVFNSLEGC
jgi:hypothetical protein